MMRTHAYPGHVAFTPDGLWAYVSNGHSNTVSVIDTQSEAVTQSITVGSLPGGLTVTP